ncbi:excisionase [Sinorhizobium sp. M4_45]|nr:excisionase [Sinorhizobium sp. M4_45]
MPLDLVPTSDGAEAKSGALLSPARAAEQLGISTKTLANWRSSGTSGLKHVQVGSRIFYRQSDIHAYIARNAKSSTSERGLPW